MWENPGYLPEGRESSEFGLGGTDAIALIVKTLTDALFVYFKNIKPDVSVKIRVGEAYG